MPRPSPRPKTPKPKPLGARTVALVGRINVGKSSLFNRLVGERRALVSREPGTTRDRQTGVVEWNHAEFELIDTGGVEAPGSKQSVESLDALIAEQAMRAVSEADLALLIVSAEDGVLPQDLKWADKIRGKLPIMLVVNKVDNAKRESTLGEFYRLGLGEPIPVAAVSGRRSGDLLDVVIEKLAKLPKKKTKAKKEQEKPSVALALIGQPNSGKSSLVNAILGEPRVIVSATPRTTREPIDSPFTYQGTDLTIIDTAGIRRKAHVTRGIEAQGVSASLATIARADIVLLLLDIDRGPTLQDQRLAHQAIQQGKGIVLVVNKWDLVLDKTSKSMNETERRLRGELPGLEWAPMVFISAKTKQRVMDAVVVALEANATRHTIIEETVLNDFLRRVVRLHRPSKGGGVQHPKILSFKQTGTAAPTFEMVTRGELHPSYLKFLENQLREEFGFVGTPIQLNLRTFKKKVLK